MIYELKHQLALVTMVNFGVYLGHNQDVLHCCSFFRCLMNMSQSVGKISLFCSAKCFKANIYGLCDGPEFL